MAKKNVTKKNKSSGKFLTVMILILIPLLSISAVFLIIAKFNDVNAFDKMKELTSKLPFVEEQENQEPEADQLVIKEQLVSLQAEIQEKEAELFKMEQSFNSSVEEVEELRFKQEELLYEIQVLQQEKNETSREFTEIVSAYEKMSAKSVAPVLTKMSDEEAIRILISLKPDTLASILEKLPADDAARYTSIMSQ